MTSYKDLKRWSVYVAEKGSKDLIYKGTVRSEYGPDARQLGERWGEGAYTCLSEAGHHFVRAERVIVVATTSYTQEFPDDVPEVPVTVIDAEGVSKGVLTSDEHGDLIELTDEMEDA
jgi:hypothetical protein